MHSYDGDREANLEFENRGVSYNCWGALVCFVMFLGAIKVLFHLLVDNE